MEFILTLIQTYADSTPTRKAIYTYDTEAEAMGNFHSYLGSAMKSTTTVSILCICTDKKGFVFGDTYWQNPNPIVPVEPTEE